MDRLAEGTSQAQNRNCDKHMAGGEIPMDKIPLIAINPEPVQLWYEGPTFLIAEKPSELAVHPVDANGQDGLVNRLLQANRWLAEMETSHTPGVIHVIAPGDRGLVLIAKSDEMALTLRNLYHDSRIIFSYRVRIPISVIPETHGAVSIFDHQTYHDQAIWDIDTPIGDTQQLRHEWLGDQAPEAFFVLYRMSVPAPGKTITVGLGERIWLPTIDLYTVPP